MIAHRRGHNFQAVGAIGYINEVEEAEKINNAISKYLDELNIKHIDVSPGKMSSDNDLAYGVNLANKNNADLFISVHFNSTNKDTFAPIGTEVWVYDMNTKQATDVVNALGNLGFKNRGVKINQNFYELRNTKMKAMIIEICFVNSKSDVEIYQKIGYDKIAKTIVETLTKKSITKKKQSFYRVVCGSFTVKQNAIDKQNELKKKGIDTFLIKEEV